MIDRPLMPKATAVWLVENTGLTFEQIGDFCGLHHLEVKGIADGEVAQGIKGLDPVATGQLSREDIQRCEQNPKARLTLTKPPVDLARRSRGGRYTPVSKRQDRPNAISWLLRNHPELSDAQLSKLVGTTKSTIQSIRDRSHWNMQNIKPQDPVTLGLCSQIDLDEAVTDAQTKLRRAKEREERLAMLARNAQFAADEAAGLPSTQPLPQTAEAGDAQTPGEAQAPGEAAPGEAENTPPA
ncbi:MAG: DUF1013 domain-containing protein [Alphaproteobacteria bacterium]|nr:DUF1013 domain-containing protein [Alphaproteobacteria bacterium]